MKLGLNWCLHYFYGMVGAGGMKIKTKLNQGRLVLAELSNNATSYFLD